MFFVTASSNQSLNTLLEAKEPAEWEYRSGLVPIVTILLPP